MIINYHHRNTFIIIIIIIIIMPFILRLVLKDYLWICLLYWIEYPSFLAVLNLLALLVQSNQKDEIGSLLPFRLAYNMAIKLLHNLFAYMET